jgi:hypothetical protein
MHHTPLVRMLDPRPEGNKKRIMKGSGGGADWLVTAPPPPPPYPSLLTDLRSLMGGRGRVMSREGGRGLQERR